MCLNSANSSADFTPHQTNNVIIIIGSMKIKLYMIRYIYHRNWTLSLSDAKYQSIVIYGHEVQGSKNKLTINQTTNAHTGDVTFLIIFCIFGLHANGTSIRNHSPYRKKSLIFANQTIIHKIQTIRFIIMVLVAVANAENNHNHIAK